MDFKTGVAQFCDDRLRYFLDVTRARVLIDRRNDHALDLWVLGPIRHALYLPRKRPLER